MKSLLILLFSLNSYCYIYGAEVAQCTAISFNLNVSLITEGTTDLKFSYYGNIAVAEVDSFHSSIHLTNTKLWSANESIYYQSDVPYFNDLQNSLILCPTLNGSGCNLTVLDGYMFFELPTMFNGYERDFGIAQYLVIDQGTLIDDDGFSFDPVLKPCMSFTESHTDPLVIQHNYCCTSYTYMAIPDEDPNPCIEFQGTTMFADNTNANIISLLTTNYGITSSGLNVTLTTNSLQPPFIVTYILPNYVNYSCVSTLNRSCNFLLTRGLAQNSLYNMVMSIQTDDNDNSPIPSIKIIKRNGIYLKNNYQLFTPNDLCSSVTTPFVDVFRTLNTLCCTKFQESVNEENLGKVVQSKRKHRRPQPKPFRQSSVF